MPHGAGPGSHHRPRRDVAIRNDAQRRHQFGAEEVGAIAVLGQSGEGMDGIVAAHEAAEIGLHAPDGEDDFGLHAIALLRPGQRLRPFIAHGLALGRLRGGDALVDILLHRLGEFGLLARQLDHLRNGAIAGKGGLEGLARDTCALSLWPEIAQEIRAIGQGGAGRCENAEQRQGCACHAESGCQRTERSGHLGPRAYALLESHERACCAAT